MKYDKDILYCRRVMLIIGLLQFPAAGAVYVVEHNWISAFVCAVWAWACFRVRDSMDVQQKTRDSQRLIMATLDGQLAETIGAAGDAVAKRLRRPPPEAFSPIDLHKDAFQLSTPPLEPGDAAVDAMDKAYGYKAYKCPKCGRLSHLPAEVEPYCIECLAGV